MTKNWMFCVYFSHICYGDLNPSLSIEPRNAMGTWTQMQQLPTNYSLKNMSWTQIEPRNTCGLEPKSKLDVGQEQNYSLKNMSWTQIYSFEQNYSLKNMSWTQIYLMGEK